MDNTSRISVLATQITKNTAIVNDYLLNNDLPQPSFSIDGPTNLTFKSAEAEAARLNSIGAAMELQDLLQGPIACLRPAVKSQFLDTKINQTRVLTNFGYAVRSMPPALKLSTDTVFQAKSPSMAARSPFNP